MTSRNKRCLVADGVPADEAAAAALGRSRLGRERDRGGGRAADGPGDGTAPFLFHAAPAARRGRASCAPVMGKLLDEEELFAALLAFVMGGREHRERRGGSHTLH